MGGGSRGFRARSCRLRGGSQSLNYTSAPAKEVSLPTMPRGLDYLAKHSEKGPWKALFVDRDKGPEGVGTFPESLCELVWRLAQGLGLLARS